MDSKGLRDQKPAAPNLSGSGCPLISIVAANEHGLVMMSRMGFDVSATVSLGFHLTLSGNGMDGGSRPRSEFISAEAIVVESECHPTDSGEDTHRVTMLFSEISRRDRQLLVLYSQQEQGDEVGDELDGNEDVVSEGEGESVEKLMDSPSANSASRDAAKSKVWLN